MVGLQRYSADEFNNMPEKLQQAVVVMASYSMKDESLTIDDLEKALQFVKDIQKFKINEEPRKSRFQVRLEEAQRLQQEQSKNRRNEIK